MEFALRINPGLEARNFLENRVEKLREGGYEKNMDRLHTDVRHILSGKYDKLKKDSRFRQFFLGPRTNLRMEKTTLGETLQGAFAVLDGYFNDQMAAAGKGSLEKLREEHFQVKLDALEKLFSSDISTFDHYFIMMFLRYTYHGDVSEGQKLDLIKQRFKGFVSEEDTLLRFFFFLDRFHNLNMERASLEQSKKSSLDARLEEQVVHGTAVKLLERQVVICHLLSDIARKLIEISKGHNPLDEVRRVLDEVYAGSGNDNVIKGMLEKFREFYSRELDTINNALVYKRILHMSAGSKEASRKRKQWIAELTPQEVEKLVGMLELEDGGGRLTPEQQNQVELHGKLSARIKECREKSDGELPEDGCLDEGEINLLILRLSNDSLENEIARAEKGLSEYRKSNSVEYQKNIIQSYNDNLKRLTQCLHFFIELSAFKRVQLERRARAVYEEVQQEVAGMEEECREKARAGNGAEKTEKAEKESGDKKEEDKKKEKKEEEDVDPASEKDPDKRAILLAKQLKKMSESAKIKPLKELAYTGGLEVLKYVLPLNQYHSEFLRNLARNTVIKIILRVLRDNEEQNVLGIQQKKKLVDFIVGLDKKYFYLQDMELGNQETTQKVFDILIREDKDFTARTLSEILAAEDDKVRATAVKMIADMLQQQEASLLMKMLSDPDARVRANVIESLEEIGNRNVLGILMKYKYDKDNRVRANALKAMWRFGNREIIDSLEAMILSEEEKMRASAAWLIGEIGQNEDRLKNLLKAVEKDRDEMVKSNVDKARAKIKRREEGVQIVVADDDLTFCQNICREMKKDGFRPTAVFNGKAALSAIEKQKPDVVLLDLRMPVMNGLETLKALRMKKETENLPVIVMSDLNSGVLLKQVSKEGADDYILKPCSYEQVKTKLQGYI